jgi:hypothetical protein
LSLPTKHLVIQKEKEMNIGSWKSKLGRRFIAPAVALAMTFSFGAYEVLKPAEARAATAAPAASALDDNSVSSLVALDNAVEAVAARVQL